MVHNYHPGLEGYDARQIWIDGCGECEYRGATVPESVGQLDLANLARAWERMGFWRDGDRDVTGPISGAEVPLLRYLETLRNVNRLLKNAGVNQ